MTGITCYSQSPNLISYQTVIRNGNNELVSNTTIGVRISILGGPEANVLVYQEEHAVKTNINGLAYLTIGNGKILNGLITSIDWSKGPYFIKSETDPTGGKNYSIIVISQILSAPYAIYANTAGKLTGPIPETDPVFNGSIAKGITATDTSYWNKKLNSSDTSRMLANYRTSINNKLDAKDTSLMLSNYLKKSEAVTSGGIETDPVFNGSIAKGITANDTSYWNRKLNSSDTSGILANFRTGLNQKLNITDTAKMLVPYLRDADTTNMLANYRTNINNKLNAKDTTLMLSNYLKKSEGLNESDPLFNGSIAKGITAIDTSNWNKKLSALDTSGMLANYRTSLNSKLNISDTTKMLSVYLKNTDTIQLSNKIQELVTKVGNLDSNSLNFNSSYTLKSFTVSQGETQIFIDTLLKDNEIWEFQVFMECDGSSGCSGINCQTRQIDIPISFLDANEIKLVDNSYFKSYKATGSAGSDNFGGARNPAEYLEKLYPLSNINNDIIYNNEARAFNCLYNRYFEGNIFWNMKNNSIIKIKAIYSGGSPNYNTRMILKILKR